ncbi:M16 family metallopeptidase [Desulfobacca acetoxidans]|uniref:Processing peptidase n=1 Tax=Desulfobacca acetoxidans (strain ATCC 700848 / DSM 11109 / ASRB2) TaxID=880072 RepID=F2NH57_DESAR|nr:insulinase family protein [Desulfobacca acetoxidans]AEB08899.1 processing peptidase [Desulfobacca acetoxidans DSM 11109]
MSRSGRKTLFFTFAVLFLCLVAIAHASDDRVLGQRFELPNGLVWLFSAQSDLPMVTMELTFKAGALFEPQGKQGLANLTASLLRYGTKSRNANQIAEEIDFLGASLATAAGRDVASLRLSVLKKDLRTALEIGSDLLFHPTFAPREITAMVQRVKATLISEEDEPGVVAGRAFRRILYGDYPYGFPVLGTPESLNRITRRDLVNFHQRYYRPNNAILTLVGDLTVEEAEKIVEEFFGNWQKAELPPMPSPPSAPQDKPTVVKINKEITQANIILGQIGLKRADPDFYAFQLMNYILGGGGFASRLMDNIRDNRGLAYSVSSNFSPGIEPGPFEISLETKNASGGEAVAEVLKELARIRTDLVTEKELADARSYLIGSLPMKMDSNTKRAALLGYLELYGLGLDYPWRYPEIITKITREDILQVAQKYLVPDRYLLVVVGKQQEIQLSLPEQWQQREITSTKGE